MSNYIVTDTELTSIANTIRTKSGQSGSLNFPNGFISGINSISGGGSSWEDITTSCTLYGADIDKVIDWSVISNGNIVFIYMTGNQEVAAANIYLMLPSTYAPDIENNAYFLPIYIMPDGVIQTLSDVLIWEEYSGISFENLMTETGDNPWAVFGGFGCAVRAD